MANRIHPRELDANNRSNYDFVECSSKRVGQTQMSSMNQNPPTPQFSPIIQYENLRKKYFFLAEEVRDTKIVEKLGSIMEIQQKQSEYLNFKIVYYEYLGLFDQIKEIIHQINLLDEKVGKNGENIRETVARDITEIHNDYKELIDQSSLRYLYICLDIFEIEYSDFSLIYNIKVWKNELLEHIQKNDNFIISNNSKKKEKTSYCCGLFKKKKKTQQTEMTETTVKRQKSNLKQPSSLSNKNQQDGQEFD